jgi:hypothetical protein
MAALRRGEVAVIAQWSIYPTRMQLLRVGPKANAKGTGGRKMFERFVFVDRHFFFFGCVERKYQVLLMRVLTNSIQTISCGETCREDRRPRTVGFLATLGEYL